MTYDVTSYLDNQEYAVVGAILGNGWYNSRISKGSAYYAEEGNDLAIMAKLLITMEDGSAQVLRASMNLFMEPSPAVGSWKVTSSPAGFPFRLIPVPLYTCRPGRRRTANRRMG
ncbi:hypothetical protein D3C75_693580 [compost metagenome]